MLAVKELALQEKETIIALRRHFHEYPELSQQEFATMDYIEEQLHAWNIPTVRVPKGGVVATVDSGKPGWTVLVRADIDALAIDEKETNLTTKKVVLSKAKGVMHACGHDGHMAMALTEAKILAARKNAWDGKVIFILKKRKNSANEAFRRCFNICTMKKFILTCATAHMSCGDCLQARSASSTARPWRALSFLTSPFTAAAATVPVRTWHQARLKPLFP